MPRPRGGGFGRRDGLVWILAALPPALVLLSLVVPSLRDRLLGNPLPTPTPTPAVATPSPAMRRERPSQAPPQIPPEVPRHEGARGPASQPSVVGVAAVGGAPSAAATPLVLRGPEVGRFFERAYRAHLPASVGTLDTQVAGGNVTLESEVDFARLGRELHASLPIGIAALASGRARVKVTGHVVGSAGGIVRLHLDRVGVGGIPIPEMLLEHFLRGELEGRGYEVTDPLVRPLYLPPGIDTATVEDDRLTLNPRHAP